MPQDVTGIASSVIIAGITDTPNLLLNVENGLLQKIQISKQSHQLAPLAGSTRLIVVSNTGLKSSRLLRSDIGIG